jgi:uncharacterized protein (TIGR02246 family)
MSAEPHMQELAATSNGAPVPAKDDAAVQAVFAATSRAWADGDANAFADSYAEDATVILPGVYLRGKAEIRARMAAAFAGALKGSRRRHAVQSIRSRSSGTAIVITISATVFPDEDEPAAERRELATWLFSQRGERWLVEAYHSCPAG